MSPTKPELQVSAAVNLAAIQTHANRLRDDMLALYALDIPPPVEEPEDPPPVVIIGAPEPNYMQAAVPDAAKQLPSYIGIGGMTATGQPVPIQTEKLRGVFRGYNTGAQDPATGHGGTLWMVQGYDVFGLVEDCEAWDIGDFVKGKEGHVLYLRCAPHLDTTIRRLKVRRIGGQAVQREFRLNETKLPEALWRNGGGTFTVEDCDLRETGLIDEERGGTAVRASWTLALYATMQTTIVRRVTHVNFHSPKPHEGSIFIGPGQAGFRTPQAVVSECDLWTESSDRSEVFFGACDEVLMETTALRGSAGAPSNYIAIAEDCKHAVVRAMPQNTEVRIQGAGDGYFRAPKKTYLLKAGATLEWSQG